MTIKFKALNGVKWTSISSIIISILQLAQVSILARYLEPSDFGLMAIASVIIGFSALFMDMGISSVIIHKQDITHKQLSSLYWLNILSGLFLLCLIYYLASVISIFYDEVELIPLIQLLAVTFFISAIGNQFRILYQKNLQFNKLAKVEIVSAIFSFFVAIYFAVNEYGAYSLVYATLAKVCTANFIYLIKGVKHHKPTLIFSFTQIKELISFGLFQMGERSINYFNSQFDIILIGKLLGAEALGVYSVAKTVVMKPAQIINPIITKVAFPIMSTVQNDNLRIKNIYLKTINYLCSINFPIYIATAILAEPIVVIMFGKSWGQSVPILQVLSFYFMFRSIGNPVGALQLAKGRADLGFYWNLGLFFLIPMIIYFSSYYGLLGISISLLCLQFVLNFPNWYFMVNPLCGATFNEYFKPILIPLSSSLLSAALPALIYVNFIFVNEYISSLFFLFTSSIIYIGLVKLLNKELWSMLMSVIRK